MFRSPLIATLLLLATVARAQVCPPPGCRLVCQPENDLFLAYESATRTAGIFRGLVDPDQLVCAVTTTLLPIPPVKVPTPLAPVTVTLPGGGILSFLLGQLVARSISVGGQFDGGTCFSIEVRDFHTPAGAFMLTDACGVHTITIQSPKFLCVTPTVRFLCFGARNVDPVPPLPPDFDRAENVCVVLH